jgi:hypothetical protein
VVLSAGMFNKNLLLQFIPGQLRVNLAVTLTLYVSGNRVKLVLTFSPKCCFPWDFLMNILCAFLISIRYAVRPFYLNCLLLYAQYLNVLMKSNITTFLMSHAVFCTLRTYWDITNICRTSYCSKSVTYFDDTLRTYWDITNICWTIYCSKSVTYFDDALRTYWDITNICWTSYCSKSVTYFDNTWYSEVDQPL